MNAMPHGAVAGLVLHHLGVHWAGIDQRLGDRKRSVPAAESQNAVRLPARRMRKRSNQARGPRGTTLACACVNGFAEGESHEPGASDPYSCRACARRLPGMIDHHAEGVQILQKSVHNLKRQDLRRMVQRSWTTSSATSSRCARCSAAGSDHYDRLFGRVRRLAGLGKEVPHAPGQKTTAVRRAAVAARWVRVG